MKDKMKKERFKRWIDHDLALSSGGASFLSIKRRR